MRNLQLYIIHLQGHKRNPLDWLRTAEFNNLVWKSFDTLTKTFCYVLLTLVMFVMLL